MAPRRGGGGGYSSGSSSCYYCDQTITLRGSDWQSSTVTGLFAMFIILMIILVVCMVLTRRFKWIRERGTDKLRNSGYLIATLCMFFYHFIRALYLALGESRAEVKGSYYIGFIFQSALGRVGDVLIIAIIARTITEDVGVLAQKFASFGVGVLWAITTISFGFIVAYYAEALSMGYPEGVVLQGVQYTGIIEASYALLLVLFLCVLAVVAVLKRSSKGAFLMLLAVMPALFVKYLIQLVSQAVFGFGHPLRSKADLDLNFASGYIPTIANMFIFLTVALIGGLRQRHSDTVGMTQEQKLAQAGPHYVAVGPYAAPDPYNPHGSQIPAGQPQPFQYAAPQYVQPGQQPMQYAQYPAPGQFVPQQQHAEMSNTPAPAVAKTASPVQYAAPVPVSPAPYGAPSSSSVSPPPQHDPYQLHMQQQQHQQLHQ